MFTQFHQTSARNRYPMRAVVTRDSLYLFNPWANGSREFRNESQSGRTFRAMRAAARNDTAVAARVELFLYRKVEEFYDLESDPDALSDRIDDPDLRSRIDAHRQRLERWMESTSDPALQTFRRRNSSEARAAFLREQDARSGKAKRPPQRTRRSERRSQRSPKNDRAAPPRTSVPDAPTR